MYKGVTFNSVKLNNTDSGQSPKTTRLQYMHCKKYADYYQYYYQG